LQAWKFSSIFPEVDAMNYTIYRIWIWSWSKFQPISSMSLLLRLNCLKFTVVKRF